MIRTFHKVTGGEVATGHRLDLTRMGGGVSDDVSPPAAGSSPYGDFSFVVVVEPPTAPGFYYLRPAIGRPDRRGIYWTHDIAERPGETSSWGASKIRRNVKLTWRHPTKAINASWETLNRVLESLDHRKSPCS